MRKALRVFVWVLAIVVILTAGAFTYLRRADLSVYEEQIEGLLSDAIGHKLDVDGLFELRFGGMTQLTAEKIKLSNTDWQPEPVIVSVGHLSVTIDLWSLVVGPIIIEDLDIRDVSVHLERNAETQANWISGKTHGDTKQKGEFDPDLIVFKEVRVQGVQFTFADPARRRPLNVTLDHLTVNPDENNILDLDLSGKINEIPLWADGKLGPWENFIDGKDITADLDLTLGRVRFAIEGMIADLPTLTGVEMLFSLSGPAIDRVADVLGLPPFAEGEFDVNARIRKLDEGNQLRLEGNLGAIDIFASGNIDQLINPELVQLDFSFSGPDIMYVAEVFGVKGAQAEDFQVSGDLKKDGRRFTFSETRARIGKNILRFDGWLDFKGSLPDGDITLNASGPDFSVVGPFIRIRGIPAETFNIGGRIQKTGTNWRIDDIEAVVGENRIAANGAFGGRGSEQTEISFAASGPDVSVLKDMTGLKGLPARPFDISALVKPVRAGVMLEGAKGVFGDNRVDVDGVIGTGKGLTGTSLNVRGKGPELNNVALLTGVPYLPSGPFEFAGRVRIDRNTLYVNDATAVAGGMRGSADGTVSLGGDLGEFDLEVSVSGSDVANLMQAAWLERIAGESFKIAGHIRHRDEEYHLDSVSATVGNLELGVDGELTGAGETADLSVKASSPDSAMLSKLTGLDDLPVGALSASGRIERKAKTLEFTDMEIRIGEYSFAADGTLSTEPNSNRSDLRFSASGPELKQLGLPFDLDILPAKPFSISGELNGIPTGFAVEEFFATVGDNKIDGRFTADLRDKPEVIGFLSSSYLDLREKLLPADAEAADANGEKSEFLFSNEPLDLEWLRAANVDVTIKTERLMISQGDLQDFHVGLKLWDGALVIDPISFRESEGSVYGSVHLGPSNGSYALAVLLNAENAHLGLLASEDQDRATLPPFGGQLELTGVGNSLHELMTSSNGKLSFNQGAGRIQDLVTSRFFGDLFLQVIRTLNPLRTAEGHTTLECGIYGVDVKDGVATIENLAIQTDKITFVIKGTVNFGTEHLSLSVQAKPREGLGISIGGVANSFLKLGGTLQSPRLQIDPTASVTATGAAVATGGLSLIAKGLWDRVTAQSDICRDLEPEQ